MNRKKLLALIAKNGYAGKSDLADIQKWLEAEGIELRDDDGVVDIVKAWNTKATIVVEPDAPAPKPEPKVDASKAMGAIASAHNEPERKTFGIRIADMKRKEYAARAARRETKYADPDTAELVGASLRLGMMTSKRMDYPQKANDEAIVKALNETTNTAGGYLVPPDFVAHLIYATEPAGVARKIANVVRMTRDTQTHPRKTGIGSMTAAAESDTATDSSSSDTFDQVSLTARKAWRLVKSSTELLEDSAISVADTLTQNFVEAYDLRLDQDYILGDGTSTYNNHYGLTSSLPTSAYKAQGTSNTWATQVIGDIIGIMGLVENVNPARCMFLCSRQYYFQVLVRLDTASSQFRSLVDGNYGMAGGTFLGYPVLFSSTMPTASATSHRCLYFGDFVGASMIGERRDLQIKYSDQRYFDEDKVAWMATCRYAVHIHGDGRGSTYGPIVALKTS